MRAPSYGDAYQVLVLQAADDGRGPILFGDSLPQARTAPLPFLLGKEFPDVYLEHPLIGDPFIDVTVLYGELDPGERVESPAAGDHGAMLDWYAAARSEYHEISCGFELDTSKDVLPMAAVHFQPRGRTELVRPFCEALGEPERAELYLDRAVRMPEGWPLSFFGMFRGRPAAPLRVCGYLGPDEKTSCAQDPRKLARVFDEVGFSAYDSAMLDQVAALMAATSGAVDFQFDVFPYGGLSSTFAIDLQFDIAQPEVVCQNFTNGNAARVMELLEGWGAADERWKLGAEAAFARALPIELDEGGAGRFAFTLMPQWAKARWTDGVLQPSKLYHLAHTGLLEKPIE